MEAKTAYRITANAIIDFNNVSIPNNLLNEIDYRISRAAFNREHEIIIKSDDDKIWTYVNTKYSKLDWMNKIKKYLENLGYQVRVYSNPIYMSISWENAGTASPECILMRL